MFCPHLLLLYRASKRSLGSPPMVAVDQHWIGRSLTLEAPGGVMHTFNNSTPIQSRRYQTNTKNYFDTFALAYFFALFNSTKISQLIRQYFTFGSFINYERLEESPARKEKSRFSWLQISVVFHREFRHLRTGLQAPAVFCNRHTFPNFLPSTGKPVAGSVLGKILRIAQICNPISQAIVSNDRSLSLIFFARKRTILQISGEVGQAFSCGNLKCTTGQKLCSVCVALVLFWKRG